MANLSKLEEIKDLREVWPHEALDFTPWLSQDNNIAILADAIGLDITVDETESSVGDFNVDIFASETGTDPACGSGSLLLKAAKILGKKNVRR